MATLGHVQPTGPRLDTPDLEASETDYESLYRSDKDEFDFYNV